MSRIFESRTSLIQIALTPDRIPTNPNTAPLSYDVDLTLMNNLPTKKSTGDVAREVGRAVASLVPAAGGPLAA